MSKTIDGVPRELIEWIFGCTVRSFFLERHDKLKELRALLAAPAVEAAKCGVCGQGAWACNEGGCHYLESGNGAPAVERQEPFMYGIMQPDGKPHWSELCVSGQEFDLESEVEFMNEDAGPGYRIVALYTSPPAPVAVVLPERNNASQNLDLEQCGYVDGWNACLDKVKELNQ